MAMESTHGLMEEFIKDGGIRENNLGLEDILSLEVNEFTPKLNLMYFDRW